MSDDDVVVRKARELGVPALPFVCRVRPRGLDEGRGRKIQLADDGSMSAALSHTEGGFSASVCESCRRSQLDILNYPELLCE